MDLLESYIHAATAKARETGRKFVFVLDEFPRLLKRTRLEEQKYPSFESFLQRLWDEGLSESPVMFILLGSSVSMMHEAFSNAAAPLFGRRTAYLALRSITMDDLAEYLDLDLRVKDHRWQPFYIPFSEACPSIGRFWPRPWNSKRGISLKASCGSSPKSPSCERSSTGSSGRNL